MVRFTVFRPLRRAALLLPLLIGEGQSASFEATEKERLRCTRPGRYKGVRKPFDLNETFAGLLNGTAFQELKPKVLSADPLVIYFENFLTEQEVKDTVDHMFNGPGREGEFESSSAGGDMEAKLRSSRYSETAFCTGPCDTHKTIKSVRNRASEITKVPQVNFDFSQALRYKEGMFYKPHHDNHPTFHFHPPGARIFTYFVYLSEDGLVGGDTHFPNLGITAPAKRGAAVLFANTKDRGPMETDRRTLHESLPVTSGLKRGMNMWLYQYNFREFFHTSCSTIELADDLGVFAKPAAQIIPQVTLLNHAKNTPVHLFEASFANRGYVEDEQHLRTAKHLAEVKPGENYTVASAEGQLLLVRTKKSSVGGKLLLELPVSHKAIQRVHVGKKTVRSDEF